MMRSLAFAAALIAAPTLAHAAEWDVDPMHSSVNFSIKHMMVSTVHGSFNKITGGKASWTKPDLSDAKIDVTIDANSIDTHEEKRDQHLKSPDFFDTAKYPTITFKSTKVTKTGNGHATVVGNLTMHGVTKEVSLDVTGPSAEVKAMGATAVGAEATTTINRKDFGLNWNKALDAGGVAVGNDVKIEIALELHKK